MIRDIKKNNSSIVEIIILIYIFNMVLEESNYSLISSVDKILSVFRIAILFALVALTFMTSIKRKLDVLMIAGIFLLASVVNMFIAGGGFRFAILLMIVICSRDLSLKRIFGIFLFGIFFSTLFVVISAFLGIVNDSINTRVVDAKLGVILTGEYTRHSFGFLMSNQVPFILTYIYIYVIVYLKERMTIRGHIVFQGLNFLIFSLCGSRTSFLLNIFVGILVFLFHLKVKMNISFLDLLKKIFVLFFLCLFIFCLMGTILFGKNMMNPINIISNFRFSNMYNAYACYGVGLLGSEKYMASFDAPDRIVVDNGYMALLFQKGIVIGIILIGIYTWFTYIAIRNRNEYLLICLLTIAIANVIDFHFISYRNIPLFCIMTHTGDMFLKTKHNLLVSNYRERKMEHERNWSSYS